MENMTRGKTGSRGVPKMRRKIFCENWEVSYKGKFD